MYASTPELPATLWVKDVNTGRAVWSMDVPVQYKLKVEFLRNNASRSDGDDFFHVGSEPPHGHELETL